MRKEIDVMVPVSLELDWPTKDEIIECIIEQNELYGFKTFLLAGPGAGWRSFGFPSDENFDGLAKLFLEVKEKLSDRDITLGWWDCLTIKSGRSEMFQCIVKADGADHPFANCPLDTAFRSKFAKNVARFAKIARPEFITFEDDYAVNAAAGGYGCFCPLHLAEFERREGKKYTREELLSIFKQKDRESLDILRRYRKLTKDTLVGLSEAIRAELDKENPEIPMGLMQPGCTDNDGYSTYEVCKALAGDKHTPFSRLYGAFYCGGEMKNIPEKIYHAIYSKQHIEGKFKFYHESDTFPHTRFFSSAKQMKAFMAIAYSSGFIGSIFQTQQLLDDPNEERAYGKMFASEKKRFNELINAVDGCERIGVSLPYDPFYNTLESSKNPNPYWTRTLDMFGIPYTTKATEVSFIDKRLASYCSDEDIIRYLKGTLFIDGDAAYELANRGFGKYIGVEVGGDVATGMLGFDLGAREILKTPFDEFSKGKNMPIAHMFACGGNGILRRLTPNNDLTEVISEAYTFNKELISTAMTRFKNELGGTVIVMGMTLENNLSQSLFNYRRKRLFEELLINASAGIPLVREEPNVHIIVNKANTDKDFAYLLTLINLGEDSISSFKLYLPEDMIERDIYYLNTIGEWERLEFEITGNEAVFNYALDLCEPVYLKIK